MPRSNVLRLRRPTPDDLQALVGRIEPGELSYDDVGATLDPGDRLPDGYLHHRSEIALGTGHETLERARNALSDFAAHKGSGIVVSTAARVETGTVVAVAAPLPIGHAIAACRIVQVIDEPDRYGFAYGTIAGQHPESGEELFLVEIDDNARVAFRLVAFSRPGHVLTKLAGPIAPMLQARASKKYLQAMRDATKIS